MDVVQGSPQTSFVHQEEFILNGTEKLIKFRSIWLVFNFCNTNLQYGCSRPTSFNWLRASYLLTILIVSVLQRLSLLKCTEDMGVMEDSEATEVTAITEALVMATVAIQTTIMDFPVTAKGHLNHKLVLKWKIVLM